MLWLHLNELPGVAVPPSSPRNGAASLTSRSPFRLGAASLTNRLT